MFYANKDENLFELRRHRLCAARVVYRFRTTEDRHYATSSSPISCLVTMYQSRWVVLLRTVSCHSKLSIIVLLVIIYHSFSHYELRYTYFPNFIKFNLELGSYRIDAYF